METIQEFKCPCCGGAIAFDSATQKLKCPYCDTEFDVETLRAYDETLHRDDAASDNMTWDAASSGTWQAGEEEALHSYTCKSCGGELVTDANTAATTCPFCGNPVVLTGQLSGALRPDYVIPFKLDKAAAKAGLRTHLKGKRLLPKVFRDENHIDEIRGIYVPFWLFDADADAHIHYDATRVRVWSDSDYNYTETSHFSVVRAGTIAFDHVPEDGSSKMPDDLMESIEPYNFADAVDFQTAYLAGYLADKYDVDATARMTRANERVRRSTEQAFATTVQGYTSLTPRSSNIQLQNGRARYALYPVWLLNTSWKGKTYTFAMNGQTGKFVGDLPLDRGAYWRWLGVLTAAIGAGLFLLTLLTELL